MRTALFVLFCLGLSFPASCLDNATDVVLSEQGGLIMLVMSLTTIGIALAYAYGSAFHNATFTVLAKDELYHLLFSLALLAAFSGIIVVSCSMRDYFFSQTFQNLDAGSCYNEGSSVNMVAECYARLAKGDARALAERYIQNQLNAMMDSTKSESISIPLFNTYIAVAGAYKRVISNQYSIILSSFIIPALSSISMQVFVLTFINENVIRWFLPIAFLLRVFPPTRHMGNILIAMSLALYVLVPMLYAFNLAMYEVVFNDCNTYARAACDHAIDGNCDPPETTCSNPDSLWNVARLVPQAFFLPNLTIVLVVTFLASVHKALRVIG
ncbi:hypothetical protein L0Y65_00695 [Candidatus Micrarchaeota archaeon]|nr:hypothetical protein [Candidatus Micrarchaeota archaeon]